MTDEKLSPHDLRLRQRFLLAELGGCALRADDMQQLLDEACRLVAQGMDVALCKVLEYLPGENTLLVRAGTGWKPGVVGHARLDAGTGSPAGYALHTDLPVITNDLATEARFQTPALLKEHGVERAMNVIIRGDRRPYGVLEADSRRPAPFSEEDISFMQGAANLLGVAIERGRRQAELKQALEFLETQHREADHRVKNSLQLVASVLNLQRARLADPDAAAALDEAITRVRAVAQAHRALAQSRDLRTVSLGTMILDLCTQLATLSDTDELRCAAPADLELDAERAIPLGLVVNELLTNALRHAYPDGSGPIDVIAGSEGGAVVITVADYGTGTAAAASGLGTTIVNALVREIGAELSVAAVPGKGTTVRLAVPRERGA